MTQFSNCLLRLPARLQCIAWVGLRESLNGRDERSNFRLAICVFNFIITTILWIVKKVDKIIKRAMILSEETFEHLK